MGQKKGGKKKHASKEDGIFVHSQNGFNRLILNWCIGGCWFTPAHNTKQARKPKMRKKLLAFTRLRRQISDPTCLHQMSIMLTVVLHIKSQKGLAVKHH